MKINQRHGMNADEHSLVKSANTLETSYSLNRAQQTIQRIPRCYGTVTQLPCMQYFTLTSKGLHSKSPTVYWSSIFPFYNFVYVHVWALQRIREKSYIGFPNCQGKAVKLSNGTDDLLKNNTVTYPGALQHVQIRALIEIKVIHHIDLNDHDTSKKKKIFTSSWKKQEGKPETTPKDNTTCGRLIYLPSFSRFPYVLKRRFLWLACLQTVITGKRLSSQFLEQRM